MVPGLEIYYLAFSERQVGMASALAVALMLLVLLVVVPIQWLTGTVRNDDRRLAGRPGRVECCSCS